jgi:hypothetical protein
MYQLSVGTEGQDISILRKDELKLSETGADAFHLNALVVIKIKKQTKRDSV